MIPPLDLATARENPKFESLYRKLTTSILNFDGSSKVSNEDANRQMLLEKVQTRGTPTLTKAHLTSIIL